MNFRSEYILCEKIFLPTYNYFHITDHFKSTISIHKAFSYAGITYVPVEQYTSYIGFCCESA